MAGITRGKRHEQKHLPNDWPYCNNDQCFSDYGRPVPERIGHSVYSFSGLPGCRDYDVDCRDRILQNTEK